MSLLAAVSPEAHNSAHKGGDKDEQNDKDH